MSVNIQPFWNRARRLEDGPVWKLLGLVVVEATEGSASVAMTTNPGMLQQLGHVHGGILMTLLDSAMAAGLDTVLDDEWTAVTAQLNTHFLRPGTGPKLTAVGRVIRCGSHLAVTEGVITDENGQSVASASAQFFLMPSQK
jgi:uncharacterized protein (TIGR00369 family)